MNVDATILDNLYNIIESRKGADPGDSYTATLYSKGTSKIAQKVGEEAVETLIEGINGNKRELCEESADLLYHLLVLWADQGVKTEDVWSVLNDRFLQKQQEGETK